LGEERDGDPKKLLKLSSKSLRDHALRFSLRSDLA
jgi:hypothetical protein